jgi:uncharacterized protein YaaN involved in tellurite resistance
VKDIRESEKPMQDFLELLEELAESNDRQIEELERQIAERERFARSLDAARNASAEDFEEEAEADVEPVEEEQRPQGRVRSAAAS